MRQLILDTETTGLDPKNGDRMIEFAALEMIDRELTGKSLHLYINPGCEISSDATRIHGITNADVKDKPMFNEVANTIIEYIAGSELIIHNAKFDLSFLDFQFKMEGFNLTSTYVANVIDTLIMARQKFPGSKNNLDALCDRFKVNRKDRGFHGALIDCRLLADVYLHLTREQISLIGLEAQKPTTTDFKFEKLNLNATDLVHVTVTEEDLKQHQNALDRINKDSHGDCIWLNSK